MKGAQGETGIKGERGDPGLPVLCRIFVIIMCNNKFTITGDRWNSGPGRAKRGERNERGTRTNRQTWPKRGSRWQRWPRSTRTRCTLSSGRWRSTPARMWMACTKTIPRTIKPSPTAQRLLTRRNTHRTGKRIWTRRRRRCSRRRRRGGIRRLSGQQ